MSQDLKRSQKTDFSAQSVITRERSFVRSSKDALKRRSQTMATLNKQPIPNKPTLEIYRPPNVRSDLIPSPSGLKLNVHAKEFTMMNQLHHHHNDLQSSRSHGNIFNLNQFEQAIHQLQHNHHLQHSKSSGNVLRHLHHHQYHPMGASPLPLPLLQQSSSASHMLSHMPRVGYPVYNSETLVPHHPVFSGANGQFNNLGLQMANSMSSVGGASGKNLKRSKSLGSQESKNLMAKLEGLARQEKEIDMGIFESEKDRARVRQAVDDPNRLSSRAVMDMVKTIMEKAVEGIRFCETVAKICITIIEKEKNPNFLESLLNTCQQWYQERDKILRGIKAGDGTRFTAFMWFLTEMCAQLKRYQREFAGEEHASESIRPELVLLSVLAKCCQACVSLPIKCLSETECLFFVLTSIGRDLETELPQQLEQLLASVRDGFLASAGAAGGVRRTLLQLIELHASNWQLPGSSVLYYYPRIK